MLTPSFRSKKILALSVFLAGFLAACESNIVPIRPLVRTTTWVPDRPATTAPATQTAATHPNDQLPTTAPSTQTASTQHATTRPGHNVVTVTDPNEAVRYIYDADYDNLWKQSLATLTQAGFLFDRLDYRLGVITTRSLPSAQIVEFWKPEHTTVKNALENTINNQRRIVRITIAPAPNKPNFYRVGILVTVERQSNPGEDINGPIFVEGSAYGRAPLSLRSDYASPIKGGDSPLWVPIGHDPTLEHKLLNALFTRI